jgi:hypothetical protein
MDASSSLTAQQAAAASAAADTTPPPAPRLSFPHPLQLFAHDGKLRHHAYSRKQKSLGLLCSK